MLRTVRSLAAALLLAGCGGACETATCLADRAVADWAGDPAAVTARVTSIPDEFTRTVVVGRLCEAYPGATRALCASLPMGPSRERCDRLNSRPHLSVVPGAAAIGNSAATGGVPSDDAPAPELPMAPPTPSFPEVRLPLPALPAEVPDACADVADRGACLDRAAANAVIAGQPGVADAICARHADTRWADECRFSSAEEGVRARRGEAYPAAAVLCGASSRFAQECWAHVLTRLPRNIPLPNAAKPKARAAIELAATIRRTWEGAGERVADVHVGRFWALYFANVYRRAAEVDGTPLDVYPEEAWPHARAAATVRLHALGRLQGGYAEQLTQLREALAHRKVVSTGRGEGSDLVYVPELGAPVTDGPTVSFLGAPRRALGADEEQDLRMCLVESAARTATPQVALLREAAAGDDPRVAAEARRLLEELAKRP